jgi:hypothetical protein
MSLRNQNLWSSALIRLAITMLFDTASLITHDPIVLVSIVRGVVHPQSAAPGVPLRFCGHGRSHQDCGSDKNKNKQQRPR